MGSFSWLKADELTRVKNVAYDKPFKFLIPKEFGGGFIKDHYQDYGYLGTKEDGEPKYDMFELLAFWNAHMKMRRYANRSDETSKAVFSETLVKDELKWDGEFPLMKEIDEYTDHNRCIGIDIGCYDCEIDLLDFPLKLVSASYKGTYEECDGKSYSDPDQGFYETYRD
jgi:hypothetical protein